jgi:hypothetical protein
MQQASQLYQKKDWNGLAALTAQALRSDSKDGWAWYYSGLANDGLGRRDQAAAAYENARNLVPDYLRNSVVVLLAQDYSALSQNGKLVALFHELEKSHPDWARSLQAQYHDVLAAQPAPSAAPPEVSPRTLGAALANAQRAWHSDAIPVMVDVQDLGSSYKVAYQFYSPSSKTVFSIIQALGGTSNLPQGSPNTTPTPIPASFLPLDAAIGRAPERGAPGTLAHAFLYRAGGGGAEPTDLIWTLAMNSGTIRGVEIPAYILPKDRFERLLRAAQGGNADAQLLAARVYALGIAGPPDPVRAFQWCSQSAERGNVEARNVLGQMYEFGRGTPANVGLAVRWYQSAASAGFAAAEYNLGLMFETGRGVARNYVTARAWIDKAARQGLPEAQSELAYITPRANGQQQQQARQAQAAAQAQRCPPFAYYNPGGRMCNVKFSALARLAVGY